MKIWPNNLPNFPETRSNKPEFKKLKLLVLKNLKISQILHNFAQLVEFLNFVAFSKIV